MMSIKAYLISKLVQILISQLVKHGPDLLRKFADYVLDWVEEYVLGSASKVDDRIVLPICHMIRETFDIPDDDEEHKEPDWGNSESYDGD